jgi:phosphoserine phosphatase RsbU/P
MLSRTSGCLFFFTVLSACPAGLVCSAQQAEPGTLVRYHFGDDSNGKLGWASSSFEDNTWPVAKEGNWPMPPFYSDGFVWVRARVQVPNHIGGTLAIRTAGSLSVGTNTELTAADEIFVDGLPVGSQGSFPPHVEAVLNGRETVFDLPPGTAQPGTTAVVAYRVWYPPYLRQASVFGDTRFEFGESSTLHLAQRTNRLAALIASGPGLALDGFIVILGVGLLIVWRWIGGHELPVFGVMLISMPLFSLNALLYELGFPALRWWVYALIAAVLSALSMGATVELVWTVHAFQSIVAKRLYQAAWIICNAAFLVTNLATTASPWTHGAIRTWFLALLAFNLIQIAVNLWAIFVRKKNKMISLTIIFISVSVLISMFGGASGTTIGMFSVSSFGLAFRLAEIALFIMLGQRAWAAWRSQDDLRAEFEAAREVQEQLVTPAVDLPGFKIESVYAPAKQVGGDLFRVLPGDDGSALIVMGDVSGKGLRAAMTVSAIMGALRGCESREPGRVLEYLNRVLYGQVSGFVTCCVAHISRDGLMAIANAGNPAPYLNGMEMVVEPGLPLGLVAEANYAETRYTIAVGDGLTFVSDGVLEATNAKGELFGFERTQSISTESANRIAKAAELFGQEDDITVLTLTRENIGAAASAPTSVSARPV